MFSTMSTVEIAAAEDDPHWQAVQRRDRSQDGAFVYSVRTTGVYCRPSCASRPAKRENVRFHATPADAEAAGFRACKRCRPDALTASPHTAAIARACRAIEAAEETPSLESLAGLAGLSPFHFHRVFKSVTGVTPRAYAQSWRQRRVKEELARARSVTEAIYDAGYSSSSRFYERSTGMLGMTPAVYRDGGRDAEIRFALGECSLGSFLVAATPVGVCAIQFGDNPEAMLQALQDRFPRARLIGGDAAFEAMVARVVGLIERPGEGADLPLDMRGTAFQQKVWAALRRIPAGRTASYAEVAEAVGMPRAVRAVAQACAANEIAVAIPCHRVIRRDGSLSGYRWGVERKQALLARETS